MPYWKKALKLSVLVVALCGQSAFANINIRTGYCNHDQQSIRLQAQIELAEAPTDALHSGIGLRFRYELEQQGDGWWRNTQTHEYLYELYYNPIAQTYRVRSLGKESYYHRLEQALADVGTLDTSYLAPNQSALSRPYTVRTRLGLDVTHLPTSLRLTAFFSPQWNHLQSAWWTCPPAV